MDYLFFLFTTPFSIGVLTLIGSILLIRYNTRLTKTLFLYFLFVICYRIINTAELLITSESGTFIAARIGHFFFSFLPIIWLRFVMLYVGNKRFKENYKILPFFIIPVLTLIIMNNSELNHLVWKSIDYFTIKGFLTMKAVYGFWMWVYGIYNDGIYLFGIVLLIQSASGARKLYRRQSGFIIVGIIPPLIFNAVYALHLIPFLRKDFTSVSFTFTAVLCFIGITKLKLFSIVPVARTQILQDLSAAFLMLNIKGQIIDFNKIAEEILELNEDIIGDNVEQLSSISDFIKNIDETGSRQKAEGQLQIKNKFYSITWTGIDSSAYNQTGFLISMYDITTEVMLLKEKTDLATALENTNRELKNAQSIIIQQEKLATIGQLTAGIAHEINNPLSFIRNNFKTYNHYLQIYEDLCIDKKSAASPKITKIRNQMKEILQDSEDGANRVIKIVQDLLKFSRPVRAHEEALYDLNKSIETSLIMMGNQLKYISVIEKKFGNIPRVECRENEINQVLINLLSNAVYAVRARKELIEQDYMPMISIETWADDNFVFCRITNNGIPILKKDLPFLFEPFYTTKKSGEGTGLGLTISKDIIEGRYHGSIQAVIDEYTQFIFSVPIININRSNEVKNKSCVPLPKIESMKIPGDERKN